MIIRERDMAQGVKQKTLLQFERPLVIVGGGFVDISLLQELAGSGAAVIGADGGADICAEALIVPDAIIGDMDSLKNRGQWEGKTQLIEIEEQDTTDFEKCLYSTRAPMRIALGMSGGRLDHTLGALDVLVRFGQNCPLVMVSEEDLILVGSGNFCFDVETGARVSVHPMAPVRFAGSKGLEFPLAGVELAPGKRTGICNKAISSRFEIEPESDEKSPYLVIIQKTYLNSWMRSVGK